MRRASHPVSPQPWRRFLLLILAGMIFGLVGCATNGATNANQSLNDSPGITDAAASEPLDTDPDEDFPEVEIFDPFEEADSTAIEEYDPWESYNVLAFEFNYRLDKYLVKPVAQAYNFVIPDDVQQSIFNAFQNLRFAPRFLNNVFQAKFRGAGIEASRFLINSTLGVGGLFDPAKQMFHLETPKEDTGQTLGVYGFKPGPYLVIPFIGPLTVRDAIGYTGDIFLDPFNWLVLPIIEIGPAPRVVQHDTTITFAQLGLNVADRVNFRSLNLERFEGIEEGTLDLYGAVRNAYLQNREKAIKE